jgi:hypothetical protein
MRVLRAVAFALILLAVAANSVLAAKSSATITLSDPTPAYADTITITVTDVVTRKPTILIYVHCVGETVEGWTGGIANRNPITFSPSGLYSPAGPAECEVLVLETVDGGHASTKVIATLEFEVSG